MPSYPISYSTHPPRTSQPKGSKGAQTVKNKETAAEIDDRGCGWVRGRGLVCLGVPRGTRLREDTHAGANITGSRWHHAAAVTTPVHVRPGNRSGGNLLGGRRRTEIERSRLSPKP